MRAVTTPPICFITIVLLSACNRAPSRAEALTVLRTANPALDTAIVIERVWADGPPWFSCAEVIAKLRSGRDSAAVREQVGNWRSLILANWVTLRDTSAGPVTDPGWCRVTLHDEAGRRRQGWRTALGDSLPSGKRRQGWDAPAGRQRIAVERAPRLIGADSAEVDYVLTVAPNANGVALGANLDAIRRRAVLGKVEGRWRVVRLR